MFLCWLKALGIHSCGWWGVIYTYGRYMYCQLSIHSYGLIWKTQKLYSWKTPIVGGSGGYRWIYLMMTYTRNSRAWRGGKKCFHPLQFGSDDLGEDRRGAPLSTPHLANITLSLSFLWLSLFWLLVVYSSTFFPNSFLV